MQSLPLLQKLLLFAAVAELLVRQTQAGPCDISMGTCRPRPDYGCRPDTGQKCCKKAGAWRDCPVCPTNAPTPSALYGCAGELWDKSRLLDWSYAGYMYGDYKVPRLPVMANVKTLFGAKGDGVSDDTAAFELALESMPPQGTLFVPKGVYPIARRLDIDKRIFIRGEGGGQTVLYFPKSLQDIYGNTYAAGISQYAFGPGFINFNGADFPNNSTFLAKVTRNVGMGRNTIPVDSAAEFYPGQMVRIVLDNVGSDMLSSLNQRMFPPFAQYKDRENVIRWTSRVKSVYTHFKMIELERSLPFNVDVAWQPEIHAWLTADQGVKRNFTGVADLTIRFPGKSMYAGENKEVGYNGLYFYGTAHSWVKNVIFENAEFGVAFDSGSFNTVDNVTFTSTRPTSSAMPYTGARGIWNKGTFDNLVTNFFFETTMVYEISTSYFAVGNVYASGKGVDMTLEFMYGAPYGNLFTNIHLGKATKPFGWVVRGQDAAGYNTFWNIRTGNDILAALPPTTWAPRATFVSAEGADTPSNAATMGWYVESRSDVYPYDLWTAMARARNRPLPTPKPKRLSGPGYGCLSDGTKCCRAATAGCKLCPANAGEPSLLYGCTGELWSPQARLVHDWGWAGYRHGGVPPASAITVDLKAQHGARGDGITDDTAALMRAINSVNSGVIYMPPGVYLLTAVINIRKAIVLRGAGAGRTILRFPKSMTELYGNTWVEGGWQGTSQYSHGTGFINIGGWDPTGRDFTKLTWVKADASRGDRLLKVGSTARIDVGSWYRVLQKDPGDGSLMAELNGGVYSPVEVHMGYADPCRFLSRVVGKGTDWIRLERPLPYKVQTGWSPEIHKFMPMLNDNTGLEYFTVDFPWSSYAGHFLEQGFNAIHLNQVVHGWVRGVAITNSDSGIYMWGSVFTTLDNILLTNSKDRGQYNGHRGIWLEHGSDCLIKNFKITHRFIHDLSVSLTEQGSVFTSGNGYDINLDHHRMTPYQNLFTNIDMGLGSRVFVSSGDAKWGPHSGYMTTFHNLQADMQFMLPQDTNFGANLTFIGLPLNDNFDPQELGWHVEILGNPFPRDLHADFARTRSARNPVVAS